MSDYNMDALKSVLSIAFDMNAPENSGKDSWVNQMATIIKGLVDDGADKNLAPDIIIKNPKKYASQLPKFFERFKTFIEISDRETASNKPPTFSTIADYVKGEREYINTLKKIDGFADLATLQNAQQFMKNDVSVKEVSDRVDNAFYAVKQADPALRAEINRMFPNLNDNELAKVLVSGNLDAATEALKIQQAGINVAGQGIAGYKIASDTYALAQQGVTRADAVKAFGAASENIAGLEQAANMFGESTADLQKQLEQEQLGVVTPSKKISGLASQARAQFEGGTGMRTGSLTKPTTGKI